MRVREAATGYGTCGFHQRSVQNTVQAPESSHRVILLCQVHLLSEVRRVVTFLGMGGGGVATRGCKGCSSCFLYGINTFMRRIENISSYPTSNALCSYNWIRKEIEWGRLLTTCPLEILYVLEPENRDICSNNRVKYLGKPGLGGHTVRGLSWLTV